MRHQCSNTSNYRHVLFEISIESTVSNAVKTRI